MYVCLLSCTVIVTFCRIRFVLTAGEGPGGPQSLLANLDKYISVRFFYYLYWRYRPLMPKVTTHWTFHQYFSLPTCHSVFPLEHGVTPAPLMQHKIFPREDVEHPAGLQNPEPIPPSSGKVLILKPQGEVSRINWGGYNLQDKLGWPSAEYEEIQVSIIVLHTLLLLKHCSEFCCAPRSRAPFDSETMEQTAVGTPQGGVCKGKTFPCSILLI